MRIVSGIYGSRRIQAPKGEETRPTLDQVREAVFSSLGGRFEGGVFLDLYAGSGANGLEALSRGFEKAVFVDVSGAAVKVIKDNISLLGCKEQARVLKMKDMKALELFREEGLVFDLVYLDPPYKKQHNDEVLAALSEYGLLAEKGRVVIESLKEDRFEAVYGDLKPVRHASYGISGITYYSR
ncbi:MAG: 16S rRNA (guanine(966)-N(2))-methyltransferase RsmD [Solobacterium sp.]|nr:16S rRNA (guanine(966)-N(2))-methyltransferase RsmD [Solobacterium sp.]